MISILSYNVNSIASTHRTNKTIQYLKLIGFPDVAVLVDTCLVNPQIISDIIPSSHISFA
ncbi:Hypothetical protein FKW44_001742, partial [Caligus rogercresseyi]